MSPAYKHFLIEAKSRVKSVIKKKLPCLLSIQLVSNIMRSVNTNIFCLQLSKLQSFCHHNPEYWVLRYNQYQALFSEYCVQIGCDQYDQCRISSRWLKTKLCQNHFFKSINEIQYGTRIYNNRFLSQ